MTTILLIASLILFILAAFNAQIAGINLTALGLACYIGSLLV